jgi:hypothetical protein
MSVVTRMRKSDVVIAGLVALIAVISIMPQL